MVRGILIPDYNYSRIWRDILNIKKRKATNNKLVFELLWRVDSFNLCNGNQILLWIIYTYNDSNEFTFDQ